MGEHVSLIDGHIDNEIKQTNYDRIKAMSVEEMADFIKSVALGLNSDWVRGNIQEWLESEVTE